MGQQTGRNGMFNKLLKIGLLFLWIHMNSLHDLNIWPSSLVLLALNKQDGQILAALDTSPIKKSPLASFCSSLHQLGTTKRPGKNCKPPHFNLARISLLNGDTLKTANEPLRCVRSAGVNEVRSSFTNIKTILIWFLFLVLLFYCIFWARRLCFPVPHLVQSCSLFNLGLSQGSLKCSDFLGILFAIGANCELF